jgi:hypothetical protein
VVVVVVLIMEVFAKSGTYDVGRHDDDDYDDNDDELDIVTRRRQCRDNCNTWRRHMVASMSCGRLLVRRWHVDCWPYGAEGQ